MSPMCGSHYTPQFTVYFSYLRQGGNVFAGFCLFVCLLARKLWVDLSEILRVCRAWHKLPVIQFWGDPAGILDSGSL